MRLLICAGGTGGGVYPARTILQALLQKSEIRNGPGSDAGLDVLWVGGIGGMEAGLVRQTSLALDRSIPYREIPAAGVHGISLPKLPGNLYRLSQGYSASRKILGEFRPQVLLFTGGYLAVPMALAGSGYFGNKIPAVLYVPDIEPGLALKVLSRFADNIAVTTEDSRKYYRRQVSVTGYPVRPDLLDWEREQALQSFGLEPDRRVLLVFGGSSGAQSLNRALIKSLPELLKEIQIIHISGSQNWEEVQAATQTLKPEFSSYYHPYPYLHSDMGAALRAADLVVSRSGASCLGEYPAFGLPAILVPYPYAWRYQQTNAEYLASRGAAIIMKDNDLMDNLAHTVNDLFSNPARLDQMRLAMQKLACPDAAEQIAELVEEAAMEDRSRA